MDEQVSFDLFSCAEGQLHVGTMHWVAGLERDHAAPAQTSKFSSQFGRSETQRAEVVMRRHLQAFDPASHVPRVALVQQVIHAGMNRTDGSEYRLSFRLAVWLPDFLHMQNRQHDAFGIA